MVIPLNEMERVGRKRLVMDSSELGIKFECHHLIVALAVLGLLEITQGEST